MCMSLRNCLGGGGGVDMHSHERTRNMKTTGMTPHDYIKTCYVRMPTQYCGYSSGNSEDNDNKQENRRARTPLRKGCYQTSHSSEQGLADSVLCVCKVWSGQPKGADSVLCVCKVWSGQPKGADSVLCVCKV